MALWGSLQVKFGLSYIAVIAAVLLLLNTYPLLVSEDLVFRSKETTMQGVCIQQKQHRRNDGDVAQAKFQLQTAPESSALIL